MELFHFGTLGMRWGIRKYQNADGSLTTEGKIRYGKNTLFVSGSSKTQFEDNPYYRKKLPKDVRKYLNNYIKNKDNNIVVGDAPGIDRQVQDYLNKKGYKNIEIYGPGKQVRYKSNKDWVDHPIDSDFEIGSPKWLAVKDKVMEKVSNMGLAVVLENGGAVATRNNIERLINNMKDVKVYELYSDKKKDGWIR